MISAWIGVDLDGTLAKYDPRDAGIGEPIPEMVELVKEYLKIDCEVRIVTARAFEWLCAELRAQGEYGSGETLHKDEAQALFIRDILPIHEWCEKHIGESFPVTALKDYGMLKLYDDRAIQVEHNTGRLIQDLK